MTSSPFLIEPGQLGRGVDLGAADGDRAVGSHRHHQRLVAGVQARRILHLGEVDVEPLFHHRRGDHEDDQQHQHDIHQGCHIDVGDEPVFMFA